MISKKAMLLKLTKCKRLPDNFSLEEDNMANNRIEKINEEVRKELSGVIREMKDDRIPVMTSVVKVSVTPDFKFAKVYISIMGSDEQKQEGITALKTASGFIRHEMASRVNLRITPQFTFVLDDSIEHAAHINELLHGLEKNGK